MGNLEQERQVRESVQHIADTAAKQAVREMLVHLGIDASDPIKTQAEFQAVRMLASIMKDDEVLEDLAFIRRLRTVSTTVKDTSWQTIVRIVVTATLGLIAIGTKDWWIVHLKG